MKTLVGHPDPDDACPVCGSRPHCQRHPRMLTISEARQSTGNVQITWQYRNI